MGKVMFWIEFSVSDSIEISFDCRPETIKMGALKINPIANMGALKNKILIFIYKNLKYLDK